MAEPPQMAVPAEMSALVFGKMPSARPSHQPNARVAVMVKAAKLAPLAPALSTTGRSMPKPNRTTQICSRWAASALPSRVQKDFHV